MSELTKDALCIKANRLTLHDEEDDANLSTSHSNVPSCPTPTPTHESSQFGQKLETSLPSSGIFKGKRKRIHPNNTSNGKRVDENNADSELEDELEEQPVILSEIEVKEGKNRQHITGDARCDSGSLSRGENVCFA